MLLRSPSTAAAGCYKPSADRNMIRRVWVSLALVNLLWILFFSTPDSFLVFVQKRSSSSEKEEFCIKPQFDCNWTTTEREVITTSTILQAGGKSEEFNSMDKYLTSAAPQMKTNINPEVKPKVIINPPEQRDVNLNRRRFNSPNVALHCCFMFSTRMVAKEQIRSYHITGPHCSKSAVLFVMMSGSYICVNPKLLWVQKIMKGLDKKRF
ncbi:uncharacterized protein LOC106955806 [Poecilia latipinna]|uniref:uncharacterized protein LOC106955806 n=1 Tax=Poecilia latipinna TaxID=48699 RepID=UPI00072DBF8E|nr:PREDICTED: uncharacterized protein LOC106955806 [Poecilia latipinna]